jgi:N-acetylglucosaminyl-diphospho-decaprenol L-rhamnosyltransferase
VPCIEGACFVMRRADLEAIGGFDEDFFLYYEEESLVLRLARLGGGAVYEPRAEAEHSGAASTARVSALATRHFHRSRVIFYRKRDGELLGVLSGLLLAIAVIASVPSAAVNALLRRRRRWTLSECRQALRGLMEGVVAPLSSGVEY